MLTCLGLCSKPKGLLAQWCSGCLAKGGFEGLHDKLLLHSDDRLHAAGLMLHWSAISVIVCSKSYNISLSNPFSLGYFK